MSRAAPLRIPDLSEACPAWGEKGFRDWASPLPAGMERSRSIGVEKVYERIRGREARGVVLGTGTPAVPSAGDLLRRGKSLCERSVIVSTPLRGVVAVQASRVRELNRTARPMEPGATLPVLVARSAVAEAFAALELGDVEASDLARYSTLPYPHRAGSSPCSGERRPAAVLADLRAWRDGDAHDGWTKRDALKRARALGPEVKSLGDVERVALAVERRCVQAWADWVDRAELGPRRQVQEQRRAVREAYKSTRKRGALARLSRYTVG